MTTEIAAPSQSRRMSPVFAYARRVRILFEIEISFTRTASALIPRVGEPEIKYRLCEHIWESVQHARYLRERGGEMSGFGSDEKVRPAIARIFEEAVRAPDALSALAGFYSLLKARLLQGYRDYLGSADSLADWPTTELIREFIRDEERHAEEMRRWLERGGEPEWMAHLEAVCRAAGGLFGEFEASKFGSVADGAPYRHPSTCNRGRFPVCAESFGNDPARFPIIDSWLADPQTDARIIRMMVYIWLMNEMDAVDYLSTVLYDTPQAPLDLHYDLARHLWDESRHSQFGYRQLPKLGIDLLRVEEQVGLYDTLVQMEAHERYALMTMRFEAGSFDIKARVMDRVRELGDFEADTLLAFDRNDEQNHVRYGHRWLPELLKMFGEKRDPKRFLEETLVKFLALQKETQARIPHGLPEDQRITADKIRELVLNSA